MQVIVQYIGTIVLVLLVVYGVLFILYKVWGVWAQSAIAVEAMPVLQPIPIPTKHQDSWLKKLLALVFEVRKWRLVEDWCYKYGPNEVLVLHNGFEFDGASIPKLFWALLSPTGLLLIPGLIHDYGYTYDQIWKVGEDGRPVQHWKGEGKEHWDQVFLEVANDVNKLSLVNALSWLAVTVGGERAWNRHRKNSGEDPPTPTLVAS